MEIRSKRLEHWKGIVRLQEDSGQPVRVFCEERGLSEPSFYSWRKRLRTEQPVSFALVQTVASPADREQIEIVLTGGERLHVPCDAATLRVVLSVLRERP